jgi:hypothetical protein
MAPVTVTGFARLNNTPNTVKTNTQAIYRKLGVSARQDAVVQANHLGDLLTHWRGNVPGRSVRRIRVSSVAGAAVVPVARPFRRQRGRGESRRAARREYAP